MPEKKPVEVIKSPRLELVPFTLNLLLAAQEGRLETIEKSLRVTVPDGWPHKDVLQYQLPEQIKRLKADPGELPWLGRLMIQREEGILVGGINVKGPPGKDGAVEIGYQVEPAFRNQGYATEATHALVDWLFQQRGVKRVRAKCKPDNEPSLRILHSLGMNKIGAELTERLGEMHIYEAKLEDFLPPDDS